MRRIPDLADDLIGEADAAKDLILVGFPEALVRLPSNLADRQELAAIHRLLELLGKIGRYLLQHRQRNVRQAIVRALHELASVPAIAIHDLDPRSVVQQTDRHHRAVVIDQVPDFALEAVHDLIHAADRLKERGLVVIVLFAVETVLPKLGIQQFLKLHPRSRFAHLRHGRGIFAQRVSRCAIHSWRARFSRLQVAEDSQQPQQLCFIVGVQRLVEAALRHRFGQQLADVSVRIIVNAPPHLGLSLKRVLHMKQVGGCLDDIDLQRNAQFRAVMEHAAMMVWNPPRAKVDIKAFVEVAPLLGGSVLRTLLGDNAPTTNCKVTTARAGFGFKHGTFETRAAELISSRQARNARAQNQHSAAVPGVRGEFYRSGPRLRLGHQPHGRHRSIDC